MKTKLIKFFNLIKENKQTRILFVMTIAMLFIFTIGYSLSVFTNSSNKKIANIKVNDLSFNITTNSGESDDRILHLQAGKTESFDVVLTNLNKVDVKYELRYELCNNQDCTSTSNEIPSDLQVYKENEDTNINGSLELNKTNSIRIITINNNSNDYYIKLNINAGYEWNNLALTNQINESYGSTTKIVAYVDGKKVENMPSTCVYKADLKGYKGNKEVELENASAVCDFNTNKWTIKYTEPIDSENNSLVDRIAIYFTPGIEPGTFADDSWAKIAEVIKYGHPEAYAVGSEKEILIDNKYYTVRVANNTTPSECSQDGFSQTACGFVVEFAEVIATREMNPSNTYDGGWPTTTMRSYLNESILGAFPVDLRKVIIDTYVLSGHGSSQSNFTSTDKLYLLSTKEVWGRVATETVNETRQLEYYGQNGVTFSNYSATKKKKAGTNQWWWLRAASSSDSSRFAAVDTDGSPADAGAFASGGGVSPAFRIG